MKYIVKPQEELSQGYCDCSNCSQGYNAACPTQMAYCEYYVSSANGGLNSDNANTVWNIICFWD
jgi:Cys-rich peptide (Clo7bot family)